MEKDLSITVESKLRSIEANLHCAVPDEITHFAFPNYVRVATCQTIVVPEPPFRANDHPKNRVTKLPSTADASEWNGDESI
jgi:hypothetical protein